MADYAAEKLSMRDWFWKGVYDEATRDERVVIITADMGAPGLDIFKLRFPARYINVGVAEQQAILAACGLAREGFIPFVYAIMPFITYRCYEQIKTVAGLMNIPINIVGFGSGFSNGDVGPTHHSLEDLAIMNMVPHLTIFNCSSGTMAEQVAHHCVQHRNKLKYIRLDREPVVNPINKEHQDIPDTTFAKGFIKYHKGDGKKTLITTGNMIHSIIPPAILSPVGVIEVFRIPFDREALLTELDITGQVFVLEENSTEGGLGDIIRRTLAGTGIPVLTKGVEVKHSGYAYIYGGRREIHKHYHLTTEDIVEWLSMG